MKQLYIGFDPRETACFAVARYSARKLTTQQIPIHGLVLNHLRARGLYTRPTERRGAQLWDVISDAPMSTEFAISRFLVPQLAGSGLAAFVDCDVMFRANPMRLFDLRVPGCAVTCVKHNHLPSFRTKMDNQQQTRYPRKNWSSVLIFDCDHPSNAALTLDLINTAPGRDLHAFCWLKDEEIGALPTRWNYLVGHTRLDPGEEPAVVHWTDGAPCLAEFADVEYAEEFHRVINRWAS